MSLILLVKLCIFCFSVLFYFFVNTLCFNMAVVVLNPLVTNLLYVFGSLSSRDIRHRRSKWRLLYQMCALLFFSGVYLATIIHQLRHIPKRRDHSLDLARVSNLVILTLSFIYLSGLIMTGLARHSVVIMSNVFSLLESVSKEMEQLKAKLGVRRAPFNSIDNVRLFFYWIFWLCAYFVEFYSIKITKINSSPLGYTFVNNTSFALCGLVDHSFICYMKKMAYEFETLEIMLTPLLAVEDSPEGRGHENQLMYSVKKNAKVETVKALYKLHR